MTYIREDEADIRVSINGVAIFGSWATYDGAGLTATDAKTRLGGMGPEVSAGGPPTRGNLTLTTQFTDTVAAAHMSLEALVGNGDVSVSVQYLDITSSPIDGAHFTITGTLIGAERPKSDANGSAVTFYTLTVSTNQIGS